MPIKLYPSNERGHANHGWLIANHYFSFGQWYNPEKIQFGALRVLNDDVVSGNMGFGKHPHDNMEIITIPFEGKLKHSDSMGNEGVISSGEVQVMSAGTGIYHSEINPGNAPVKLFQVWIFPDTKNVTPRYDQRAFDWRKPNSLTQIVSPIDNDDAGLKIHQRAWLSLGNFTKDAEIAYSLKDPRSGIFLVNIDGVLECASTTLKLRDAIGINNVTEINIKATTDIQFLILEVPVS